MGKALARAEALVDLSAIESNVAHLRRLAPDSAFMAVVKADGYGHGLVPAALAALNGGASWLGVALVSEALDLRAAGVSAPVLAWLLSPSDDFEAALAGGVDLSIGDLGMLTRIVAAARRTGRMARIHIELDTGMSRGGCGPDALPGLASAIRVAASAGIVDVVGVWSHLACADEPSSSVTQSQLERFHDYVGRLEFLGIRPPLRHVANSAALLSRPDTHLELIRCGLACYGISPIPRYRTTQSLGLLPAMTLASQVVLVRRVVAGIGVSYGHTYRASRDVTLALVAAGYADGVPRSGSNTACVRVSGREARIAGSVCMDQFLVDVGSSDVAIGDDVVVFGCDNGTIVDLNDFASRCATIAYEVLTGVGPRVPRRYLRRVRNVGSTCLDPRAQH